MSTDIKSLYDEAYAVLESIDEQLDSVDNSKAAGRRSVVNGLVKDHEELWTPAVESMVSQLNNLEPDALVGVYNGILRQLEKELGEKVNAHVTSLVESQPETAAPKLTPEDLAKLTADRAEVYKKLKTLKDVAKQFGFDEEDFPAPRKRTGAVGPRGKRAISYFTWKVDEKDYDTLAEVAADNGYPKAVELRKAMKAADINLTEPPDTIEFEMANGKKLVGKRTKADDAPVEDSVDDDDETDETTEDETTETE